MSSKPKLYRRRPLMFQVAWFKDTKRDADWVASWVRLIIPSGVNVYERHAWGARDCWIVAFSQDGETIEVAPGDRLLLDDDERFFVLDEPEFEATYERVGVDGVV